MRKNLASIFYSRVGELGDHPAFLYKVDRQTYLQKSWSELGAYVRDIAGGLASMGLKPGGRVAIFSQTSHFWVAADLATISNGAVSVPIYPTSSQSDIEYILKNSDAEFVFVQNERLAAKIESALDKAQHVRSIILMQDAETAARAGRGRTDSKGADRKGSAVPVLTIEEVKERGARFLADDRDVLERRVAKLGKENLATIIYTSGTTGVPKGVPLTHDNIISVLDDMHNIIPISTADTYLSYLPLSHVFERICGEFYWMYKGGACAFAEGIEHMGKNMAEVKPSMILVVPRVLDRIHMKVKNGIEGATTRRRRLIEWALGVGSEMTDHRAESKKPRIGLVVKHWVAEKAVLSKLREKIGSNLRLVVSGGAPATGAVLQFFNSIGIATLEGYGLTETAAPTNVNRPEKVKPGTVGPTLPSVNLRLSEDGEILVSGPSIFKGYYRNEEATAEAFEDGWFRTGDIGTIDSDGYLRITDRKKDIIVNSAGKNIAPQRIEAIIRTVPLVNQAVVFGDKKKHLVALIALDEQSTVEFGRERGYDYETFAEIAESPELYKYLRQELSRRSTALADYEQVKKFRVLTRELSVEAGELTATLKIKRNVVGRNYEDTIAALYDDRKPAPASKARELVDSAARQ